MSILNFLKKIKLPSFEDEFIVDPVDQEVSPEHGRQMRVLAAMHREKEAQRESGTNSDNEPDYTKLFWVGEIVPPGALFSDEND